MEGGGEVVCSAANEGQGVSRGAVGRLKAVRPGRGLVCSAANSREGAPEWALRMPARVVDPQRPGGAVGAPTSAPEHSLRGAGGLQ